MNEITLCDMVIVVRRNVNDNTRTMIYLSVVLKTLVLFRMDFNPMFNQNASLDFTELKVINSRYISWIKEITVTLPVPNFIMAAPI